MKRISSRMTTFHKKVFPSIWFGFLVFASVTAFKHGGFANGGIAFLVVPCFMAVLGYIVMKKLVLDLTDEVYDAGEFLVVRNRGREYRIPLSDIINVSVSTQNPTRITLRLIGPSSNSPLGTEVAFSPEQRFTLNPFAKSDVAEELIVRVDKARSKRAG
jgi:hypothetical protein